MSGGGVFSARQKRRFFVIMCLICAAASFVLFKYARIMLGGAYPRAEGENVSAAGRGLILDRNGMPLAIQLRFGHVSVWKPDIDWDNRAELYAALAGLLPMDAAEVARRVESNGNNFLYLQKHIDNEHARRIEAEIAAGKLRGVKVEPVFGRVYPEQNLAGPLIGFVGDENTGLAGVEYAFDKELSARRVNGENRPGDQVILTIDKNVQYILEEIAGRVLEENEAEAVMLLAMDPRSGEMLGSASMPSFNPNLFRASGEQQRMNRPLIWAYEPGSVFKIFSLSLMLDSGAVSPGSVFYCGGQYEHSTNMGERVLINCLGAHGNVRARDIIIHSCNAGTAYASDRIGILPFYDGLRGFGFGARSGAELPGETPGLIRPPERWSARSRPTIAMGQEILVSAMQMMEAATAVASDGVLTRPRFIKQILSADGRTERPQGQSEARRVLRPETAREMRAYMQAVTSSIGTGWRANVADLNLAVKTGTAQVIDANTGAYSDTDFIASCIAILPVEEPTLVLYLVIVKPKGINYLGGRIAAPPIREAAEALVNYLGIPRGKNPQIQHTGEVRLPAPRVPVIGDSMPDLSGLSKKALLPVLLDDRLRFELRGDGWVRRQYPPAGAALAPGTLIILELE